jgi:hypothetical protein
VTPLEHALRLASKGHAVFPCKNVPGDKERHKTPHTPNGFHDASRNPELITTWFEKRFPEALVGVPMGDRLCALDVDLQHASAQAWCEQNKDRLPNGRIHHTQSGSTPASDAGKGFSASRVSTRGGAPAGADQAATSFGGPLTDMSSRIRTRYAMLQSGCPKRSDHHLPSHVGHSSRVRMMTSG